MTREGQTALWEDAKEFPLKCCGVCRFCAELKTPYERSDGAVIFWLLLFRRGQGLLT